jgi:sporulation protein YlmC with PRC-barrel domain
MLRLLSKPVVTVALLATAGLAAVGATGSQAQTPPGAADKTPSIAMQTTAPSGADARKLLGHNIKNMQNETIGEIKSIHLDQSGKVDAVIVSVGGFLGVGEREVLLDWRDLQIDANGEIVKANMSKDQLKAMAPYTYQQQSLRGTVFTDKGVYAPDRPTTTQTEPTRDRTDQSAAASVPSRSTGDFNVAGQMSAEALIGKTVKNATNESVGKISDIYLDAAGNVKLVVVSVGGFLGVGSKDVAVSWNDMKFGRDGSAITVLTNWTKDSLKAMPDYKDERRIPSGTARGG